MAAIATLNSLTVGGLKTVNVLVRDGLVELCQQAMIHRVQYALQVHVTRLRLPHGLYQHSKFQV
jgi:hypothetical protein